MQSFDIIVIGAGPGGLACARTLAEHGREVLVLERNSMIGPKVCGGGITWQGLIRLVPEELIEKSFPDQYIRSNWQNIRISAPAPIISTIRRETLGRWMADRALDAGAAIMTGMHVREITDRYVEVADSQQRIVRFAYQHLVGADGSHSQVRKHLRLVTRRTGIGIRYHVPGQFARMEWHLDCTLFANGYSWIFPFREMASVGVYAPDRKMSPKDLLKNFHKWAQKMNLDLSGLRPRSGLVNYDFQGWRFNNTFLVGDAAGLASGLTGEGMYPAIVSGEEVANAIINPRHIPHDLNRLIRKHEKHRQIIALSGKNIFFCRTIMELLVLALRTGLVPPSSLEMAG